MDKTNEMSSIFFEDCMRCEYAVKKRMIGSKELLISCTAHSPDAIGYDKYSFKDEKDIVIPSFEKMDSVPSSCHYYVERLLEDFCKGK